MSSEKSFGSGGEPDRSQASAAFYTRPVAITAVEAIRQTNRSLIAFDLALGSGALLAPDATLKVLGHAEPSDDARELFRRCGPIWLTYAAAHTVAAVRGNPEDWWAVAWLRGTELLTDVLWSRSPGFRGTRAKLTIASAGLATLAFVLGFGSLALERPRRKRFFRS